mgnify:CR=1 FL=1
MNALESLRHFIPELFLLAGAFAVLFFDFFISNKKQIGLLALAVLAGVGWATFAQNDGTHPLFYGFFILDPLTEFFRLLALAVVAMTILLSLKSKELSNTYEGEYYSLFLFMAFALIVLAASANLLMIFMSVEFVSILSYLLVGFLKRSSKAKEAAIKYLLYGSVASGVMLFGMSLIFGASGSLDLKAVQAGTAVPEFFGVYLMGLILFLTGLGFKISAVPFHMWAPDVYEAAPTPVTAFLTVAPKAAAFAVLIRVLTAFTPLTGKWDQLIILLSILTMTLGNLTAISQTNIKRLLAYSSIAQAGYFLMGLAAFNATGTGGILVYLLAYAFTNLGAFTIVIAASNQFGSDEMSSYAGLAKRSPFLAASLTLFLLSLAGIPPLAGFFGKFLVFAGVIEKKFILLAVIAAVNSAVAAYYYFKVIRLMYLEKPVDDSALDTAWALKVTLAITLAGTILIGIFPAPFLRFAQLAIALP